MPKKSATTRAAQRNKSKVQKHIAVVREISGEEQEQETSANREPVKVSTATVAAPLPTEEKEKPVPKGSASARLAGRRQNAQKARAANTLITAEHYSYVTKDLIFIAVLASIMFIAIIVLYFTVGRTF